MPVVITIIIVILLVFLGWTWHNLGDIEIIKKIITIVISSIILFAITFIFFNISQSTIKYNSQGQMESVRNVLVTVFTFINGLLVMPQIAKVLGKISEKQIDKEKAQKRLITILIIFVFIMFLECGYMKSIQQEILKIYNDAIQVR